MTTGKTVILDRQNFVDKVISLLFNMLSRFVIYFRSRSKHLLISRLQSTSAVILKPLKIVCHCFHCFPIYLPQQWDHMPWFSFFFYFLKFIYFSWRLITYSIVVVFALHWHESAIGVHVFPILNPPPVPLGHPSAQALSTLSHALNLDWRSVSYIIIYMFQCYSLSLQNGRK